MPRCEAGWRKLHSREYQEFFQRFSIPNQRRWRSMNWGEGLPYSHSWQKERLIIRAVGILHNCD